MDENETYVFTVKTYEVYVEGVGYIGTYSTSPLGVAGMVREEFGIDTKWTLREVE